MSNLGDYQVKGTNAAAPFTLTLHRGEGMLLLGMNWKDGKKPPKDFVGFAIEYKTPGSDKFYPVNNRLAFTDQKGNVDPNRKSSRLSPIQKFRWVHFPWNAEQNGNFTYKVTPVFMDKNGVLSYGESQKGDIQLRRETYPGQLNVSFTRGFVASQAFIDYYGPKKDVISTLLPKKSHDGIDYKATHPKAKEAYAWMGFEARSCLYEILEKANADPQAKVCVVAYDLSEGMFVKELAKLGNRLRIIVDDSAEHGEEESGETQGATWLKSAGASVMRQHMGSLQHNKMIIVDSDNLKIAVGGSTNFSYRGFYVQSNNAVIVTGAKAIAPFQAAFEEYWNTNNNSVAPFNTRPTASWCDLQLNNIDAKVTFSPHGAGNYMLQTIATDIDNNVTSSLLYSLAFLSQTTGVLKNALVAMAKKNQVFAMGMSDKKDGGFKFLKPDGKTAVVSPESLKKNVPEPFKSEVTGGGGNRLHHKFVVIDFDKPTARVYLGSYNFSDPADKKNGENLFIIKDRRIAVAYMVEAVRIFDHYQFRLAQANAKTARKKLHLQKPPEAGQKAWWEEDYTNVRKIKDRELFA